MKQLALLLVFTAFIFSASAQYSMFDTHKEYEDQVQKSKMEADKIKENKIKTRKNYLVDNKTGEQHLTVTYEYNTEGYLLSYKYLDKKGNFKWTYDYTYNDKNDLTNEISSHKGKVFRNYKTEYDNNGNMVLAEVDGKNGKLLRKKTLTFDGNHNNTGYSGYKGNGKLSYKYAFDYYPDGSRKESRWYDKNGKLKQVFTYECGEVGKTPKEWNKDTSKMCIKYEYDKDGNKVKIVETDYKGKHGGVEIFKYDKNNNLVGRESRKPNGKVQFKYTALFNSENNITEYVNYKNDGVTIANKWKYEYDTQGSLVKAVTNPGSKKEVVHRFAYEQYQ